MKHARKSAQKPVHAPEGQGGLTDRETALLADIRESGASPQTVQEERRLRPLHRRGLITFYVSRSGRAVYSITPEGEAALDAGLDQHR